MKKIWAKLQAGILGGALEFTVWFLSFIPLPALQWSGKRLGDLFYYLNTRMKQVTLVNLKLCFPALSNSERNNLALSSLRSTGQLVMEAGVVFGKGGRRANRYIESVKGAALLDIHDGVGVLLLIPHYGNWELINNYVSARHNPVVMYEPAKIKGLDTALQKLRNKSGIELFPANTWGLRKLYQALKQGRVVGLLPDQVPKRKSGLYVPFFGVPALTMTLAYRLIQRTGARVVFGHSLRLPEYRGFQIRFTEAHDGLYTADEAQCLLAINSRIEEIVSQQPDQYQWEYKRFKQAPDKDTDRYR